MGSTSVGRARPNGGGERLLATLKQCFKERGLTYKHVARSLGVSEASIKRYFTGGTVTLAQLERMCATVRIGIEDLIARAASGDGAVEKLSLAQEEGLARSALTSFVFYLVRHGWTAAEIRDELEMSEAEITTHLIRLEKLSLIDLLPANRVKVLTARFPNWLSGGPIRRQFDRTLKSEFASLDYHAPGVFWELETVKLSAASRGKLQELMEGFTRAVRGLADDDRKSRLKETDWRSVLVVTKPADPKQMRRKKNTRRSQFTGE
ncbi:MAG TPA: helix-turn-helix transcriptional regulator [Alphaproteobacteria bacterium]|nr:helix-turn-helix transcriptional regulator [Alphaproteobacteria bacterium]